LRKSSDGGAKFETKINVSSNTGDSQFPQIQSQGNNTSVLWQDNTTGNNGIYLSRSTDMGESFYDPRRPPRISIQYHNGPVTSDGNLTVNIVAQGINFPSHMAFLGPNDILILEKNEGTVKRIVNGKMLPQPLLDVNVANKAERGMLGIAVAKNVTRNVTYVFLYYTVSASKDGSDVSENKLPLGNHLYRYELIGNKLVNPKLLLNLPATPKPVHNGGKLIVGRDNNLYLSIGDLDARNSSFITKAENEGSGRDPDGRGGILRITQDGKPVSGHGILGNTFPLNIYYAYGIRNIFTMDFDPLTGALWDAENGPGFGDEINLVAPGFNSGWNKVQGVWSPRGYFAGDIKSNFTDLYNFNNTGYYSEPEMSWYQPPPGLSAIKFFDSTKLGKQYKDELFVGDFHYGKIYHFKLNPNRTAFELNTPLEDKIANDSNETDAVTFARGFGGITDIEVGPDGNLYVLSLFAGGDDCDVQRQNNPCVSYNNPVQGTIFRLQSKSGDSASNDQNQN